MKKFFFLIALMCLSCSALMAEPVSKQKALQVASQVMGAKSGMRMAPAMNTLKAEAVFDKVDAKGNPYMYVVHREGSNGYVLVSGDDRYAEVLGYSDDGPFDLNEMPDAQRAWIQGYIDEMKSLDAKNYAPSKEVRATPSWAAIRPMTTTKWYQMFPYWNNLPEIDGLRCVTGCTTTAMAQMLNYWGKKTGKPAGTIAPIPAYQTQRGIQLEELPTTVFDWNLMVDNYAETTTAAQQAEVAKLCQYIACGLQTEFGTSVMGGSSSEPINVLPTLLNYFGFDNTVTMESRAFYLLADWNEMVYNELAHQRPVMMGASRTGGAHAFIVDGYDGDGMFHVNWGWMGRSDGYYRMSVMDPNYVNDKDAPAGGGYQQGMVAFIGLQIGMDQPAEKIPTSLKWGDLQSEGSKLTATCFNINEETGIFDYGLAWLADDGALEPIVTETAEIPFFDLSKIISGDITIEDVSKSVSYTFQPTEKPAGTYKVVVISRLNGTETWKVEKLIYAMVTFDGTNATITLPASSLSVTDFAFNGSKKATYNQSVDLNVKNEGAEFFSHLYMFASTTEEKGKALADAMIYVEGGGEQLVRMNFTPMTEGTYNIWVTTDEAGTKVIGQTTVEIAVASDPVITFETVNKPAGWPDMTVMNGETQLVSGSSVARNSTLIVSAAGGLGYHIEWYVNGKNTQMAGYEILVGADDDKHIEARYVENYKFIFKGTPYVKYANADGTIYMGANFYNHKFEKLRAFGYTVASYTGSNGKTYLVDNSPDAVHIVKDTLTADVVMTPNYVLNESDLGDATVTPVWDFDKPDSVALFRNFQEKCCFVKPTWFDSNYIDMNMSCDASNGWIDNEHAKTLGYAEVGAGTKFTLPARYGTVYRMVTKEALSATTIADSTSTSFRKSVDSMGNQVATLFYNESDNDSIHIVVGEDIKLISISASYPGGDNVLTWLPDTTANNANKTDFVTVEKTGEAGGLLYDMSDLTLNGLNVVASEHRDSCSVQIEVPDELDEEKYLSASIQIGEGFSFTLKKMFVQMRLEGTDKSAKVKLILADDRGNKLESKLYEYNNADSVLIDTLANVGKPNDVHLEGKVTMKLYVYGAADCYRLIMPIEASGEICEVLRFPEGYNFTPYKAKSEIDLDGMGLLTVDSYEVIGVDDEKDHVILNAIEEVPMGDVLIIHSDEAGAVHHIPLTRADDAYVRGNNKLWVSDGTVKGGRDIYRFGKEGDQYVFRNSSSDVTLPRGEIYLKYHSGTKKDVYYLSEADVPDQISLLTFYEKEDNRELIEQYRGRTIKKVVFEGHTFFKNHMWNTLCLPFDVIGDAIEDTPLNGAELWELDVTDNHDYGDPTGYDEESGVVTLNFKPVRSIEPGKPYFMEWKTTTASQIDNPVFENVTLKTSEAAEMALTSSDGKVQIVGTYAPEMLMGNNPANLYVDNNDRIRIPTEHYEVGAFNAYFLIDLGNGLGKPGTSPLQRIVMNISDMDNTLRVIDITIPTSLKDGVWYDLQGRKYVEKPTQHGIYILNGKKIMIK